jgi:L-ascorbate metabolism protein UlaG (beta-lactamase superfamily)
MFLRRHALLGPDPSRLVFRDDGTDAPVRLQWLGTAGFTLTTPERTVVLDPFVTRPSLWSLLARRLEPNEDEIARWIPKADDVLIGHAHYDHVLDGPSVCKRTGARFIGSRSACNVARAAGVPERQIIEAEGGVDIPCGHHVTARGLPALHGRVYGVIPLPGEIVRPPVWPPRNRELRCGQVFNWFVEYRHDGAEPLRVLHVDSADYFRSALEGIRADVLCLCAIGRNYRPRYLEEIVEITRPRWIVPCHWDWLFGSLDEPMRELPGVNLSGFVDEIRALDVEPVLLPFGGSFAPFTG